MRIGLSIGTKILIAFVSIAIFAVAVVGLASYQIGSKTMEEESFKKLTAVREMKAGQIEDYYQEIVNQVITLSEDRMVIDAMVAFDDSLHTVEAELGVTDDDREMKDAELRRYYQDEFLERLIPNLLEEASVSDYWPEDEDARLMQSVFIGENPYSTGSKYLLDDPGDGTSYSQAHRVYHPVLRDYLERFGYYDIFLVDVDTGGHISYSVFKEVDYGTPLLDGPYGETNFAEAYRAARDADDPDFVKLVDFEPYAPSYNAPAAFIASPIFDGDEKIGVLVFQMPIDRINDIMTSHQKWSDVGLGESGETYIVGDDFLLRSQSRSLIEDSEHYFNMIEEIGLPLETRAKIRNFGSTIGLQEVQTEGTRAALDGRTGMGSFSDYRGVPVLSAYKPLNIPGVNWAIMSEIDQKEAFAPIRALGIRTLGIVVFLIVAIVVLAVVFSRTITRPLEELTATADELATGNLDVEVSGKDQGDEIGELASSFDVMRLSLKQSMGELQDINQFLEDRVAERTAELEQAFKTIKIQKERMEIELNFAREIQMNMLPLIFPAFPQRKEIDLSATLHSAREVGGDFYDFYFLDDDHLCFIIADVSGKGAPGALLMAVSKTLIKSRAADDHEPASILTHVNDELSRDNESAMFVTAFLGILNVRTGEVEYTNAGHNPPYIKRSDGTVEIVDAFHGPVIGALPGMTYGQDRAVLGHEDMIVLYTDGVTEAMDETEALYSDERLAKLLLAEDLVSPGTVIDGTLRDVLVHQGEAEQADDITILAVQYTGRPEEIDEDRLWLKIKNQLAELGVVEERFHEFALKNDIPDAVRQPVSIVLDEMLNNIVSYAYEDEDEHEILVQIELSGRRLVLTIKDDGLPFNPFGRGAPDTSLSVEDREIGGLGIHLVRSMMDEYLYQRQINKNVVTLVKMMDE